MYFFPKKLRDGNTVKGHYRLQLGLALLKAVVFYFNWKELLQRKDNTVKSIFSYILIHFEVCKVMQCSKKENPSPVAKPLYLFHLK